MEKNIKPCRGLKSEEQELGMDERARLKKDARGLIVFGRMRSVCARVDDAEALVKRRVWLFAPHPEALRLPRPSSPVPLPYVRLPRNVN